MILINAVKCKNFSFKLECFIHRFMQLYTQTVSWKSWRRSGVKELDETISSNRLNMHFIWSHLFNGFCPYIYKKKKSMVRLRLRVFNVLSSKWQNYNWFLAPLTWKLRQLFLSLFIRHQYVWFFVFLFFFCLTACPSLIFLHFLLLVHARTTGSNQISYEFAISNDSHNEILSMVLWNSL